MLLVERELQGSDLGAKGGVQVPGVVEASRSFHVAADEDPLEFCPVERVGYCLAVFHGDGEVVFRVVLRDLQTLR